MNDGISVGRRFVGVDLHLHRSVIAGLDEVGERLGWERIDSDPAVLVLEVRNAGGRGCPVAIEATYGWYWAVDALQKVPRRRRMVWGSGHLKSWYQQGRGLGPGLEPSELWRQGHEVGGDSFR